MSFDYNLDYFEVGPLHDPQFKIADPKVRIVERAAARAGLWGNHAYQTRGSDCRGELVTGPFR